MKFKIDKMGSRTNTLFFFTFLFPDIGGGRVENRMSLEQAQKLRELLPADLLNS